MLYGKDPVWVTSRVQATHWPVLVCDLNENDQFWGQYEDFMWFSNNKKFVWYVHMYMNYKYVMCEWNIHIFWYLISVTLWTVYMCIMCYMTGFLTELQAHPPIVFWVLFCRFPEMDRLTSLRPSNSSARHRKKKRRARLVVTWTRCI